jgi:chromosomal replication initiator protein
MQAWEQFLELQEEELGIETVQKWLRSLKIQRFDACNLYLEAKDSFQALWFEEHIRNKALIKLFNGNNKRIKIHLSIANSPKKTKEKKKKENSQAPLTPFQLTFDELDPLALFDSFVATEENTVVFELLKEIANVSNFPHQTTAKMGTFNPIYLHGPNGSGKTHLLMSLAHAFNHQGFKTIYVRADTFTDHVIAAIRAGQMSIFRQAYRNSDVLIVDDVHVFSRKGATQEEFFHTFNTLHLDGKQIILSANCPPQELQLIEPRLISRFEWGIVLPLQWVKSEELPLLLNFKAKLLQFNIPSKIAEFLIETFNSNPKSVIKALEALILRLHLDPHHLISTLTVSTAKIILSDLIIEEQKAALTPIKVIQAVAEEYGIRREDILGKAQTRDCALPRQLAMHFCRHQLKMPFMKIGDLFCRDHSTVMSSVKQVQKKLEQEDAKIAVPWRAILKKLSTLSN